MIRFACIVVLLCGSLASAQQRPLLTEDVDIIPPGTIRIEAGIDFMQGAKYPVSGIRGDLTRVDATCPVLSASESARHGDKKATWDGAFGNSLGLF